MASKEKTIKIYSDGACSGNQFDENVGGWGSILEYGDYVKEIHGGDINTTNNRMELMAVISALEALSRKGLSIHLFSDSSYIVNCMRQKWYEKWLINGWKTTARKPVENKDLWERLIAFIGDYDFRYYLVKGHVNPNASDDAIEKNYKIFQRNNGDSFTEEEFKHILARNNRADALANQGIDEIRGNE